jgi:arylsulfatase A-like enzyme
LTIAGLLQSQGYRTACIGKWHLGWNWPATAAQRPHLTRFADKRAADAAPLLVTPADRAAWTAIFSQPIGGGPTTVGFERYFGTDVPNWPPYCFIDQDRTVGIPDALLSDDLLNNHQAGKQGPALAGWTLEPILPTLVERAQRFITDAATAKQPFLLYLPLTTPHTPLAVNPAWRGRSGLNSAVADLVMETDDAIGRVMSTLSTLGLERDTLVLLSSDNGMAPYTGAADLEAKGHFPSGPLRGYKGDAYEGGHRVPFIVRWPAVSPAGRVSHQLVHQADLMATLAEVIGVPLPPTAGEDSVSLLPLLRGEDRPVREHAISAGMHGVPALRVGTWKLISGRPGGSFLKDRGEDTVSLYDLSNDLGEQVDRSAKEPERVRDMRALLERLIIAGRSTPGEPARNDVEVRRYPAK